MLFIHDIRSLICAFVRWDVEARAANAKALQSQSSLPKGHPKATTSSSSSSYAKLDQQGDEEEAPTGDCWEARGGSSGDEEEGGEFGIGDGGADEGGGPFEVQEECL